MWETRPVILNVHLPHDVAREVETIQDSDPEFLSRILLGGITRRFICEQLKDCEQVTRRRHNSRATSRAASLI